MQLEMGHFCPFSDFTLHRISFIILSLHLFLPTNSDWGILNTSYFKYYLIIFVLALKIGLL